MPYQEPLTHTLKRLGRVSNYASALQFGGKAVLGKGIALLKVPALGAFLFSLGMIYNSYLLGHRRPGTEPIYREVDELLAENAELVTRIDAGTLLSATGFAAICVLGFLLYLRGKSEYRKAVRALHNGMDLLFHVKSQYIPLLVEQMWRISFEQETRIFSQSLFSGDDERQRYARFAEQISYHCERSDTPQIVQRERLGLSLVLYEQWLQYPLFSEEDSLASIHEYRAESVAIKRRTAALENLLPLVLTNFYVSPWHSLTMARAKYLIWNATEELNKQLQLPSFITPEIILWKSPEQDVIIQSVIGTSGLRLLNRKRRTIMIKLFSDDVTEARKHIALLFQKDIANAFKIRFRYDPNYCAGELSASPASDAERLASRYHLPLIKQAKCLRAESDARAERGIIESVVARYGLDNLSAEQNRALRIAYHIDEDNIRRGLARRQLATVSKIRENLACPHYVARKTAKLQFARGVYLLSTLAPEIYIDIYQHLMVE